MKDYLTQQFGFVNIPQQPGVTGLPNITVSGYSNLGEAAFLPDAKGSDTFMASDNVLWTKGNHLIKLGGTYRWVRSRFNIAGNARGSFTFDGVFTQNPQSRGTSGNAFADFLLGDADGGTLTNVFIGDLRYKYYGAYINDDWKVTPKLTLNLGIRYEIWTPAYERHDLQANFLLGTDKLIYPNNNIPAGIPSSLTTTIPSGVDSRGLTAFHKNNWSPRIGLAYQLFSKTVIRAGMGVFYAEPDAQGASGRPVANPPFRITTSYPTDQAHTNLTFASGFPAGALNVTTVDPTATTFIAWDARHSPGLYLSTGASACNSGSDNSWSTPIMSAQGNPCFRRCMTPIPIIPAALPSPPAGLFRASVALRINQQWATHPTTHCRCGSSGNYSLKRFDGTGLLHLRKSDRSERRRPCRRHSPARCHQCVAGAGALFCEPDPPLRYRLHVRSSVPGADNTSPSRIRF